MDEELANSKENLVKDVDHGIITPVPAGTPAEISMGNSQELVPQDIVNEALVAKELRNIATTKRLIKENLVKDVDYGIIPGCGKKPSLFKPGAEKIIRIFHVSVSYEDVAPIFDIEKGNVSHKIICSAFFNGVLVQQGVGSANSFERKFYRNSARDRLALDNTILKMAKKRALVDVALQLGSLSNSFTQDVEDFKEDILEQKERERARKAKLEEKNKRQQVKESMAEKLSKTISVAQQKRLFAIAKGDANLVREAMNAVGHGPNDKTSTIAIIEYNEVAKLIEQLRKKKEALDPTPQPLEVNKEKETEKKGE